MDSEYEPDKRSRLWLKMCDGPAEWNGMGGRGSTSPRRGRGVFVGRRTSLHHGPSSTHVPSPARTFPPPAPPSPLPSPTHAHPTFCSDECLSAALTPLPVSTPGLPRLPPPRPAARSHLLPASALAADGTATPPPWRVRACARARVGVRWLVVRARRARLARACLQAAPSNRLPDGAARGLVRRVRARMRVRVCGRVRVPGWEARVRGCVAESRHVRSFCARVHLREQPSRARAGRASGSGHGPPGLGRAGRRWHSRTPAPGGCAGAR
jgi:hypothetical protein